MFGRVITEGSSVGVNRADRMRTFANLISDKILAPRGRKTLLEVSDWDKMMQFIVGREGWLLVDLKGVARHVSSGKTCVCW